MDQSPPQIRAPVARTRSDDAEERRCVALVLFENDPHGRLGSNSISCGGVALTMLQICGLVVGHERHDTRPKLFHENIIIRPNRFLKKPFAHAQVRKRGRGPASPKIRVYWSVSRAARAARWTAMSKKPKSIGIAGLLCRTAAYRHKKFRRRYRGREEKGMRRRTVHFAKRKRRNNYGLASV
jgi:hypothetical protein